MLIWCNTIIVFQYESCKVFRDKLHYEQEIKKKQKQLQKRCFKMARFYLFFSDKCNKESDTKKFIKNGPLKSLNIIIVYSIIIFANL